MDRRKFLKTSLFGVGAAATGSLTSCKTNAEIARTTVPLNTRGYISEPARQIPVVDRADVVVLGGGPAGVAAAISAARCGADVMLLERQYTLGGLWTGCCVLPVNNTNGCLPDGTWKQVVFGFSHEVLERLRAMDQCIYVKESPTPDPEAAKYMLELMVQETGVRLLYGCQGASVVMSGDRIQAVIAECKSGRIAIEAGCVVDCSGDGDILEWTHEAFELRTEAIGAMWRMGGDKNIGRTSTPNEGVRLCHMTGEQDQNGLDVYNLTRLQMKMRAEMWAKTAAEQQKAGCEGAFVLDSGSLPGVRVTRVLQSVQGVRYDDTMTRREYPDVIGIGGSEYMSYTFRGEKIPRCQRPCWQIPFSALTPQRVQNLLVGGRCFDFDVPLTYDAREVATCFVTGQAAGVAAAIATQTRTDVQHIEIARLQQQLRTQKVQLS